MSEMIERMARAILNVDREFRGEDAISDDEWRNYWSPGGPVALPSLIAMRARAALRAGREPTDDVEKAGDISGVRFEDGGPGDVWRAMIDKALGE